MALDYELYKEGGILNDKYQKIEDISEGSYGYVSLARDLTAKKLVAIKYIFKLDSNNDRHKEEDHSKQIGSTGSSMEKRQKMVDRKKSMISSKVRSRLSNNICMEAMYEVDIQTKVGKHKNIAELLDFFDSYIIMEYCSGGDLYEAIKDGIVPRKTKDITHIITQIVDAVEFVHSKNIFHRDIKPENILISGINWTMKLTDWGLATTSVTSMDRNVGSERYMAPELFEANLDIKERKEPYQCAKVDMWSLGIVFLNIVFHKNPFSVANQSDKSFCYFAANREALFDIFSTMSYDFFQVLRYSLTIDPANRDLKKMAHELSRLSEYTLDDEYYNSMEEEEGAQLDGYLTPPESAYHVPPSSAPAPVSILSPMSTSNSLEGKTMTSSNSKLHINKPTVGNLETDDLKERARSVPKFRFQKRSHNKSESLAANNNYSNTSTNHNRKNMKNKASYPNNIKLQNKKKPKIIKHSRKPLGIPTPNTHINTYFHDYKSKETDSKFNTRDFFTPPGMQNKYMESVFSNHRHNTHNNSNTNVNGRNKNFHSNGRSRRPSSNGDSTYGHAFSSLPNGKYNRGAHARTASGQQHFFNNNGRASSPPPLYSTSPNIPAISTVLDSVQQPTTYHEQYMHDPLRLTDTDNDLDDVLFTLEENDDDFVQDFNALSVKDNGKRLAGKKPTDHKAQLPSIAISVPSAPADAYTVPDLLQSPMHSRVHHDVANVGKTYQDSRKNSAEYKYKPGVYVPPHHRRSSDKLSSRRTSEVNGKFIRPMFPLQHASSTTAVQSNDVFADSSNHEVLIFEDEDEDKKQTSMLGPYEVYDGVQTGSAHYTKRKPRQSSSILHDQAVGSLEQYKNNWLALQQQQD